MRHSIKKQENNKKDYDESIKVCFLVQMPEIWDKEEGVYEALIDDGHFCVDMVVIPPYDFIHKKIGTVYSDTYFFDRYPNSVRGYANNKWIDLKSRKYDYVFYQRPYNCYLPEQYRSNIIRRYSKCCYIPYAFWPFKADLCGYNEDFYSSVYYAFMDSEENAKVLLGYGDYSGRILFCGYPQLDRPILHERFDTHRILWTPRWSYDEKVGGSHFLEYKDELLDYCAKNEGVYLTIRPHPLAFDNYIEKGLMTTLEVEEYKERAKACGAIFDNNRLIEDTFKNTGILISDISSIIFPFFVTSKPIIYCDAGIEKSPSFSELVPGMYVAHTINEILFYLSELREGKDPLKETRTSIARRIIDKNIHSTRRIVNKLIVDHTISQKKRGFRHDSEKKSCHLN